MRDFIFVLVLLVTAVRYESKEIVKRHLAERFTNNPFFLRHFGGGGYTDYERRLPEVHFLTESGPYEFEKYEDDYEDEEVIEELRNFVPSVTTIVNKIPLTEETETHFEEPIFNTLPFFEKPTLFLAKQADLASEEEGPKHDEANSEDPETLYVFKSLPHFNHPQIFREEITKSDNAIFKEQANGNLHQTLVEEKTENVAQNNENEADVAYIFTSLPHFEMGRRFNQPMEVSSQHQNEEKPSPKNQSEDASHFHNSDFFTQKEVNQNVFTSLPFSETGRDFHKPTWVQNESTNVFQNLDLPAFFNVEPVKFLAEPTLLEATASESPAPFVSRLNNEDATEETEDFRLLPRFEVANFRAVQPIQPEGRKKVRVVRRKKTRPVEFGRRLRPKMRVK